MIIDNPKGKKEFDFDVKLGEIGEAYHKRFIEGTHEVKTDLRIIETKNFYIEQRNYDNYKSWPSGINKTTAQYWVFASANGRAGLTIETDLLREIIDKEDLKSAQQTVYNDQTYASTGVLLPLKTLLQYIGWLPR